MGGDLPQDLSKLGDQDVAQAGLERDRRLTALFRRWPRLDRREMSELRQLHDERMRIARYIGRLRRPRRAKVLASVGSGDDQANTPRGTTPSP